MVRASCTNRVPTIALSTSSVQVKPGIKACTTVTASDPDAGQKLTFLALPQKVGSTPNPLPSNQNSPATFQYCWTPTALDIGVHKIQMTVTDTGSPGLSAFKTFTVNVTKGDPPTFTITGPTSGYPGQTFSFTVKATDPDGKAISIFNIANLPSYCTAVKTGSDLYTITCKPTTADSGKKITVEVTAVDADTEVGKRSFDIETLVNNLPKITSTPGTTVNERATYTYKVTATDADAGDTLTYKMTKGPNGAAMGAGNTVSWSPAAADLGKSFDFEVEVCDQKGGCIKQAWKVTVLNVNDPPKITSTAPSDITRDNPLNYDADATDPDTGDTLTWSITKGPAGASINASTGVLTWLPPTSDEGKSIDFTIKVCDKGGLCDTQSFKVNVKKLASPPQIFGTPEGNATATKPYSYKPSVIDNDTGDTHTWKGNKLPTGATINASTGEITWTPAAADAGKEFDFDIEVCDQSGLCAKQTWTVRVSTGNNLPQIIGTPGQTAQRDRNYTYAPTVRDPDTGDTHTWTLDKGPAGASLDPKTGRLNWTPGAADVGKDVDFSIKVCDAAGDCASQSWKVNVQSGPNTPPQISTTPATSGTVNQAYTYVPAVIDPDASDTHTWALKKGPAGASFEASTGKLDWTPAAGDDGKDIEFELEVCDNSGACAIQTWKVRVGNGNNPPVIVGAPKTTASVGVPYTFSPKVTDADSGDTHTWKGTTLPTGASIDSTTGAITWTPGSADAGKHFDFEIEVCDDKGACATRKWKVKVDAQGNVSPSISSTPSSKATANQTYSYVPVAVDPDIGDTLSWSGKTLPPGASVDPTTGRLTWVPTAADDGKEVSFAIEVCDDKGGCTTQTWKVRVGSGNTPPAITGTPSNTGIEGVAYGFKPAVVDPDAGDTHTWKGTTLPTGASVDAATGEVTWTPATAAVGQNVPFEIEVCDKSGSCARKSWSVLVRSAGVSNTPPQIGGVPANDATEGKSYSYAPSVIDPDTTDTHGWRLKSGPAGASFDPKTGKIDWTPSSTDVGKEVTFELELCDSGGDCATQQWKVKVGAANQPPLITSTPPVKGEVSTAYSYKPTVTDPDTGDTHTWKLKKGPSGAKVDASTGEVTWTPTSAENDASHRFELEVCDQGGKCTTQSWEVRVGKGNQPPVITGTPGLTADIDKDYTYEPKVTDADAGDKHTWKLVSGPGAASIDPSTGKITWKPAASDGGKEVNFKVEVCDDKGGCATQEWKTTVTANNPPQIDGAPETTAEVGKPYGYKPKVTDPDAGDKHTWTAKSIPPGATFDAQTGELSWTPKAGDAGKTFDVEVEVCDDKGGCATRKWRIKVGGQANTPPSIANAPSNHAVATKEYAFEPVLVDPDTGDTHTWKLVSGPTNMKVDPQTGKLTWTPTAADAGKDFDAEIEVCDSSANCASRKWKIRVSSEQNPPQIGGTPKTLTAVSKPYVYGPFVSNPYPGETYTWKLNMGPTGAKVDPSTGALVWTPGAGDMGKTFDFEIQVCDSKNKCSTRSWKVRVTRDVNTPPSIVSTPPTDAQEDIVYTYAPRVLDPDAGDKHTWTLKKGPTGATIDANTGMVRWTPGAGDVGNDADFEIEVCDAQNRCDSQTWKVNPKGRNHPPTIDSKAPSTAYVGTDYTYEPQANDVDTNDTLTWRLVTSPPGATIDAATGKVTWKPTAADADVPKSFEVEVCDNGVPPLCKRQVFSVTAKNRCRVDVDCQGTDICVQDTARQWICVPAGCSLLSPKCSDAKALCMESQCKENLCDGKQCANDEICRPSDGKCIRSCAGVTCQSDEQCVDGTCVKDACAQAGSACKADEVCDDSDAQNPKCITNPCSKQSCRHDRVCHPGMGVCVDDPCGLMTCPTGQVCMAGQCTDPKDCKVDVDCDGDDICVAGKCRAPGCYTNEATCQSGESCFEGGCSTNECPTPGGNACAAGEFCRRTDSKCIKSCVNVSCKSGERCVDGACAADPCAGVTCQSNEVCNDTTGKCETSQCTGGNKCRHGRVCSTRTNKCIDDGCVNVECGANGVCVEGQCVFNGCRLDSECPGEEICVANKCVQPDCRKVEDCQDGELCIDGKCTADSCKDKTCGKGEFCRGGTCVKTCAGVTCSDGETCVDGECKEDPCKDVTCSAEEVCESGKCVLNFCQGQNNCKDGRLCQIDKCVTDPCSGLTCSGSEVCKNAQCTGDRQCQVDADCPGDTICVEGKCGEAGCYKQQDCTSDQICGADGACFGDTCKDNGSCKDSEVCVPGKTAACQKLCPKCADGEVCVDGACAADPCKDVNCADGETCQAGQCVKDVCSDSSTTQCRYGRVCSNNKCENDPCSGVTCPTGYDCRKGMCYNTKDTETVTDGGTPDPIPLLASGGCQCNTSSSPTPVLFLFLFLLAFGFFGRKRTTSR